MYLEPEQQARIKIDDLLQAAGWILQHKHAFNRQAGLGVVVREFQLASGPCDYALLIYYRNFIIGQPQYRHSPHLQNAYRRLPARWAMKARPSAGTRKTDATASTRCTLCCTV